MSKVRLVVRSEIALSPADLDGGLVMWLEASFEDADTREDVGSARAAIVRVADAMNYGIPVRHALGGKLGALRDLFFDRNANCLKHGYLTSVGWNLIYFDTVTLSASGHDRELELTALRRVIDVWGEGSAIAVIRVANDAEFRRWQPLAFELVRAPTAEASGYAVRDLSLPWP